jgi:hypothetical protein
MFELAKLKETGFDSVWVNLVIFNNNKKQFHKNNFYNKYHPEASNNTINYHSAKY